jgi:hypothetical protein
MREEILKVISRGDVTFIELQQRVPNFSGDIDYHTANNLILWMDISIEARDTLRDLMMQGIIDVKPTNVLTYMWEGATLNLPIAKKFNHNYQKAHWLPVTFSLNK